jgi:hypothetical protein
MALTTLPCATALACDTGSTAIQSENALSELDVSHFFQTQPTQKFFNRTQPKNFLSLSHSTQPKSLLAIIYLLTYLLVQIAHPTQPNPFQNANNWTQPNPDPWMDPTHVQLCGLYVFCVLSYTGKACSAVPELSQNLAIGPTLQPHKTNEK